MAEPPAASLAPTSAATSNEPSRASTPANAPVEKAPDDGSKLKTFLGVLRRFVFLMALAVLAEHASEHTWADWVAPGLSACLISLLCDSPFRLNS